MAQQQSWYLDLRSGEAKSQMYVLKAGDHAWLTGALLFDPASAAAGKSVRVALRAKSGLDQISISLVLSAERPYAALRSAVTLGDFFWLEREDDESADAAVRFCGGFVKMPETETVVEEEEDGEDQEAVFDEVDHNDGEAVGSDEDENGEDQEALHEVDGDDRETVGSDNDNEDREAVVLHEVDDDDQTAAGPEDGEDEEIVDWRVIELTAVPEDSDDGEDDDGDEEEEEENDREFYVCVHHIAYLLQMVHPSSKFVPEALFLRGSAPRATAAGNTAGIMRVTTADIKEGGDKCDKQILVRYRYNCFSAASSVGGVEACRVEQRVQLRFLAAAGLGARSLEWVGASLAPLIYPGHSSYLLRELWSGLIADVNIPVHATRVEVFVDVSILRPADCTPERIGHMISALEDRMAEPWCGCLHGEVHLPEPVRCVTEDEADDDTDNQERPAKRRRVVAAGEDCVVCLELLEGDDLVAWPGCGKPHVFHASCLMSVLEKNMTCPICRRGLLHSA